MSVWTNISTRPIASDIVQRSWLSLTRKHAAYFLGAASSLFWLLPVFGPPGSGTSTADTSSVLRYLRIVLPLCIFFLVRRKTVEGLRRMLVLNVSRGAVPRALLRIAGLICALGLVPLSAGLLSGNLLFIVSAVLPLIVSLVFVLGTVLLDDENFQNWALGMTAAAAALLMYGMVTSHFESTSYYGRPRILLGFGHPIVTASVILAALGFVILRESTLYRQRPAGINRLIFGGYGSAALLLLLFAQSRNLLISLCVGFLCIWLGLRVRAKTRALIFTTILFLPIGLYLFVLTGSPLNPLWALLNDLSSQRLASLQTALALEIDLGDPQRLFEPSSARLTALSDYVGFAATDSVFQSFFFNYGLASLVCFLALLLALGWKLSAHKKDIYAFGAFCGMIFFFSLDTQGITTSNLVLFVIFSYAIRTAVSLRFTD